MYFVYPSLISVSVYGYSGLRNIIIKIFDYNNTRLFIRLIIIAYLISITINMYITHPFQNVYFNEIVSQNFASNFDKDYYGLSFKQALETLLNKVKEDTINVSFSNFNGMNNIYILPLSLKNRIVETDIDSADYYITNYHLNHQSAARITGKAYPYDQPVYLDFKINNSRIFAIYKLNNSE